MTEQKVMPKGWDNLSPLAKAGYVDADYVETVDDAIEKAALEMHQRKEETVGMTEDEISKWEDEIIDKYMDEV